MTTTTTRLTIALAALVATATLATGQQRVRDDFQLGVFQLTNSEARQPGQGGQEVLTPADFDSEWPNEEKIAAYKSDNALRSESGGARLGHAFFMAAAGGHADYGGNEAFRYDFDGGLWTRLRDPDRLDGPLMKDTSKPKDGITDICPGPTGWPENAAAGHTYDGAQAWPPTAEAPAGELLIAAAGGYCSGAVSSTPQAHIFDLATLQYRKWNAPPNWTRSRSAWARGTLYWMNGSGRLYTVTRGDGSFPSVDTGVDVGAVNQDGVMRWNDALGELVWSRAKNQGKGGIFAIPVSESGELGEVRTVMQYEDGDDLWSVRAFVVGSDGVLRFTNGYDIAFRVDPSIPIPPRVFVDRTNVPPPHDNPNRVDKLFSRQEIFEWDEPTGEHRIAWCDINDPWNGWWCIGEETGGGGSTPVGEMLSGEMLSFAERCADPDVVLCDPLDTEAPTVTLGDGSRVGWLNPDGSEGIPTEIGWGGKIRGVGNKFLEDDRHELPQVDTEVMASGSGALRFRYPDLSRANGAGEYATAFGPELPTAGPGDVLEVSYALRYQCEAIYLDCDPAEQGYKTRRRWFRTIAENPDAWSAMKSVIVGGVDWGDGVTVGVGHPFKLLGYQSANACDAFELVLNHDIGHALKAYHSCRSYWGFAETIGKVRGSAQVETQNQRGCWRYPEPDLPEKREAGWNYTGPNCFLLDSDEWTRVKMRVTLGPWQPGRPADVTHEEPLSRWQLWAAHEGGGWEPLHDVMFYADHPQFIDFRGERRQDQRGGYGKIWLLPYITNKWEDEEHPTFHVWYDELIVAIRRGPN